MKLKICIYHSINLNIVECKYTDENNNYNPGAVLI